VGPIPRSARDEHQSSLERMIVFFPPLRADPTQAGLGDSSPTPSCATFPPWGHLGSSLGEAIKGFKKGLGALHDEIDVGPSVQEQPKGLPGDVTGHTTVEAARGAVAGAAQGRKS